MIWPDGWRATLESVNSAVNQVPYVADDIEYRNHPELLLPESWDRFDGTPLHSGVCRNYVTTKLYRLVLASFPLAELRVATCLVEPLPDPAENRLHAVLSVNSPDGELVADSRQDSIVTPGQLKTLGYEPVEIQREGGRNVWGEWEWQS